MTNIHLLGELCKYKVKNIFDMNVFGNNLRRIRKEKGLTLKQLAEKLGIKHQSVEKWEKGLTSPKGKTLNMLLEVLNVTANDLLYEKPTPSELGVIDAGDKIIVDKNVWEARERELQLYRRNAELQNEIEHLKNAEMVVDKP